MCARAREGPTRSYCATALSAVKARLRDRRWETEDSEEGPTLACDFDCDFDDDARTGAWLASLAQVRTLEELYALCGDHDFWVVAPRNRRVDHGHSLPLSEFFSPEEDAALFLITV